MERLQKVLGNSGIASRRKAEELILNGKVMVNENVVTELGTKVSDKDIITVDGKIINRDTPKVYYLLYKPTKVITSTNDEKGRKTVVDLIDTPYRIYPVGRLDYDTTGLLILTNDGELTNILMHPKNEISKTYLAKVSGLLNKDDIDRLKRGITIDGRLVETKNFKIRDKNFDNKTSIIEISIIEGRNHIVKRIFSEINHPVLKLKRTKIDFLNLDNLKIGEYRKLTIKEVKKLYSLK